MQLGYASTLCESLYEANDPNGIRTRVTAVKGRCPGPLDDRVTKSRAISELPFVYARQIAESLPNFGSSEVEPRTASSLQVRIQFVNQHRCTCGCTFVLA